MSEPDLRFVDETVARLGRRPEAVIAILQAIQDHYRYLPQDALQRVCARLRSPRRPSTAWRLSTASSAIGRLAGT